MTELLKKKILYITNVNLEGQYLPGVINKINGQLKAFTAGGFETAVLYPGNSKRLVFKKGNGGCLFFKGARMVDPHSSFFKKLVSHLKVVWSGSLCFDKCSNVIVNEKYDAVYLRFYLPGRDLIRFLKTLRKECPGTLLLLEYPTLNVVTEMKKRDKVSRISYYFNQKRIGLLNRLTDYIITLTKDEILFDKPVLQMPNGIELAGILPVSLPVFGNQLVLLGVASDCAFYHGFDKVIKGLAKYKTAGGSIKILFRVISNPLSRNVDELRALAKDLDVADMVSFELPKSREELAEEYSQVHIGMGTLALHRIGLMDNYSLKHREYAAFGLPFVMSKGDDHFEDSPFVMTVERDEEPLDIQAVLDFYTSLRSNYPDYPQAFRKSIENTITWEAQMKDIFAAINRGKEKQVV